MSLSSMIDAAVHCGRCGQQGFMKCSCFRECACGLIVDSAAVCTHPVHSAGFERAGYYIIDAATGKPYKTYCADLSVIRKRMNDGTIYSTRREANRALRVQPSTAHAPDGAGASNKESESPKEAKNAAE